MRQEQGLDALLHDHYGLLSAKILAELLLSDLENCYCMIFGKTAEEIPVLLAELKVIPDSLFYDRFDQRIDFKMQGDIINIEYEPLIYKVEGQKFSLHGRCSTIRRVCGVDLYLNKTYTSKLGDSVRQNFSISVKSLVKRISH